MECNDTKQGKQAFVHSASTSIDTITRIINTGMDDIAIHIANRYLFYQFLGRLINICSDSQGGGTIPRRCCLLPESANAVAAKIRNGRAGSRFSPNCHLTALPQNLKYPKKEPRKAAQEASASMLAGDTRFTFRRADRQ